MKNYLSKSALILIVFFNFLVLLIISYYKHNNKAIITLSDVLLSFYIYQLIYLVIYKNFEIIYKKIITINLIFIPIILFSSILSLIKNGIRFKNINTQSFILVSILISILISLVSNNISIKYTFKKSFLKNIFIFKNINIKVVLKEIIIYFLILICLVIFFNIHILQ